MVPVQHDRGMIRLTAEPIVLDELLAAVADPKAGAVVVFIGMTRDNNEGRDVQRLEYEAYSGMAERELEKIHNLLDDVIDGRSLGELRDLFERRLQTERVQADEVKKRAFALGEAAVRAATTGADVVIEGRSKLLQLPEFQDAAGLKGLVSALEDDVAAIVRLLDATLEAGGTSVVVGREAGDLAGGQIAIVGAAYSNQQGRTSGAVGSRSRPPPGFEAPSASSAQLAWTTQRSSPS